MVVQPSTDIVGLCGPRVLLANSQDISVDLLNVPLGAVRRSYPLPSAPVALTLDPATATLYATSAASALLRLDLDGGSVSSLALPGPSYTSALGVASVFVAYREGTSTARIASIDPLDGGVLARTSGALPSGTQFVVYDRTRNQLAAGTAGLSPSTLVRLTLDAGSPTSGIDVAQSINSGSNGKGLAVSPDGGHLAYVCGTGPTGYSIPDYDLSTLTSQGSWDTGAFPSAIAFSADGRYLVASNGSDLLVFDAATHAELVRMTLPVPSCGSVSITAVAISRGNGYVFGLYRCSATSQSVIMWMSSGL